MNRWFLRFTRCSIPTFAATLGVLTLVVTVAQAQTLPSSTSSPALFTIGNTIVVSNPTGALAGKNKWGEGGFIDDPFNPGMFTGNVAESNTSGQTSKAGSISVATLGGLPTIAGVSVSITCGVTGAATASLSLSTENGSPVTLNCPTFSDQIGTAIVTGSTTFAPVSSLTANVQISGAIPSNGSSLTWTNISMQFLLIPVYYLPHLAFGGGWQTTLTYLNYSPLQVSCQTTFLTDSGDALAVPFAEGTVSSRTDNLEPGAVVHVQTQDAGNASTVGWARVQCTAPIKASLLFRSYSNGSPVGEAGVNAMAAPATDFVTFAEVHTGVAWANPSTVPASVTITALDAATGISQGSTTFSLPPKAHGSANVGPLLKLSSNFIGSIQIVSTVPIVSLSLNAEAAPVFSSLPPGDLPNGTSLATGH